MSTKVKIEQQDEIKICNTDHVRQMFNNISKPENYQPDFLCEESMRRLLSKAEDVKQEFPFILDLGAGAETGKRVAPKKLQNSTWVQADLCKNMLKHQTENPICLNMENNLPFKNGSFDLVISNMALPYVNDIPSVLVNMGRSVKKGGLILASMLGNESFSELRDVYKKIEGKKITPHFMPMPDVKEMGRLIHSCGFELPVSDRDLITIEYPNAYALFEDLKLFGGKNLNLHRAKGLTTPRKLKQVADTYAEMFADSNGNIPVTVEIIYLHGFRP